MTAAFLSQHLTWEPLLRFQIAKYMLEKKRVISRSLSRSPLRTTEVDRWVGNLKWIGLNMMFGKWRAGVHRHYNVLYDPKFKKKSDGLKNSSDLDLNFVAVPLSCQTTPPPLDRLKRSRGSSSPRIRPGTSNFPKDITWKQVHLIAQQVKKTANLQELKQ